MNITRNFVTVFLIFFTIKIDAYRILGIFPLAIKSHNILFQALMNGLARRGHQVDVISHYEPTNPHKNYRSVLNLANISYSHPKSKFDNIQEAIVVGEDTVALAKEYYGSNVCNIMSHEKLQKFIRNPPKNPPYDVVITESFTTNCYYGFGPLLKVPIVAVSACLDIPPQLANIGNPTPTSFYPTIVYKKLSIKTFWDRLQNTLTFLIDGYRYNFYSAGQSEIMKRYLGPTISSVREVEKMVSLFIMNTFYSLHGIRPIVPAVIEVGGLHIEEDDSSLTPDLKQLMDESIHGVVLVSFGTLVPIETLPKETCLSFFSSFAKLAPMRILMKVTEGFKFPFELPENVLVMKWIPQISVLRHHNTRLFISHGGIHSLMEAIYFGVPIIGIPLFYDQKQNIEMLIPKNMCLQLNYDEITENSLDKTLQTILTDSNYRNAAKYQSHIFRDRQLSPIDTATYWIEYVIKNGANSLRSPATDLSWWQMVQLDVYGFLLFCLVLIFAVIKITFSTIFKQCFKTDIKVQLKKE